MISIVISVEKLQHLLCIIHKDILYCNYPKVWYNNYNFFRGDFMKRIIALFIICMLLLAGCAEEKDYSYLVDKTRSMVNVFTESLDKFVKDAQKTYDEFGETHSMVVTSRLGEESKTFFNEIKYTEYMVLDDKTVGGKTQEEGITYGFYYTPDDEPKLINITNSSDFDSDYTSYTKKTKDGYYFNSPDGDEDYYYTEKLHDNMYYWRLFEN